MRKNLDESTIVNELRGQSAFFRPAPQPTERTEIRSEKRTEFRTEALPIRRRTKRYSFEFYDDQLTKLKRLKREAEDRGENVTLSDMARAAVDQYLERHQSSPNHAEPNPHNGVQ